MKYFFSGRRLDKSGRLDWQKLRNLSLTRKKELSGRRLGKVCIAGLRIFFVLNCWKVEADQDAVKNKIRKDNGDKGLTT